MSTYVAETVWNAKEGEDFPRGRYSRAHVVRFDGGTVMPASASASNVPAQWADPAGVDPEEMFVASLSSCHLLWFLDFARRAKVTVRSYSDSAEGVLADDGSGRMVMTRVVLRPRVDSDADAATLARLHHEAHEACFIANSVRTEVIVEPVEVAANG